MQVTVKCRYIGGAIYQAKETQHGEKYNALLVLEPGEEKKIKEAVDSALEEEFGSKRPKGLKNWALRKGDDEEYENTYGQFFINPKASKPVAVLRKHNGVSEPTQDVYPGCYVYASVNAYAYAGDPKKSIEPGVSLGLRGLMFWKDGEAIGGRFSESEFDGCESVDADAFGDEEAESMLS